MRKIKDELIYGLHTVRQIFTTDINRVLTIWVQQERQDTKLHDLITLAQQQGLVVQYVSRTTLDKLAAGQTHQGVVIQCRAKPVQTITTLENCLSALTVPPFLLVLDEVQDPHNLGACLRTADAAGVHAVIVPKHHACDLSATVRKVACGAADTVLLIQVTNLAMTLRWLQQQGVWLVGTASDAPASLFTTRLTGALALVLGAEDTGLRRLTRETCDILVNVPMFGKVASLNVSVAAAICLYEAVRQRLA
ncbi:MAG: 23S rRNA (guanosine(2251)-2'-O)-methyltransferase RlmB [Beggiatoa sp. IS2]|nr:MAG: 23S rRNA (guanosine(2251)-2'-O)-methyltransferase RlmB [Beggiatoa sp. IS2]